jgi:hypothetical protein
MRVKIFDLSWNVDLNRLENEINAFLATLPSNAVKYVQSAASSTRTGDTDQMQTDYLVTVWYEGEPKKPAAKKKDRPKWHNQTVLERRICNAAAARQSTGLRLQSDGR